MSAASARRDDPSALVTGDIPLTADNFRRIANLLRDQSGIHLPESKATLVHSRLLKRLRSLNLQSFDDYCALIGPPDARERMAMLAALTTNVTRFFREPHHFTHFQALVERTLAARARSGGRVRIWSSACSTGEEAYSIALSLLAALPEATKYDVKILATDIDPTVVETAAAGLYGEGCVAPIPAPLRERWLTPPRMGGDRWQVSEEARSLVVFKVLNLVGDWPMRGSFDAIFCRNVVIYFEEATQNRIWTRFRSQLATDGRLYVGHSERVETPGYASDGLTVYRRAELAP